MAKKVTPTPAFAQNNPVNLALALFSHAEAIDDGIVDTLIATSADLRYSPQFSAIWTEIEKGNGTLNRSDFRFVAARIFLAGAMFGGAK